MTPQIGPHGYLVLRRHNFYDLPVRFFWDRDDAIEYCDNLGLYDTENVAKIIGTSETMPITIVVLHFVNGKPIKVIHDRVIT